MRAASCSITQTSLCTCHHHRPPARRPLRSASLVIFFPGRLWLAKNHPSGWPFPCILTRQLAHLSSHHCFVQRATWHTHGKTICFVIYLLFLPKQPQPNRLLLRGSGSRRLGTRSAGRLRPCARGRPRRRGAVFVENKMTSLPRGTVKTAALFFFLSPENDQGPSHHHHLPRWPMIFTRQVLGTSSRGVTIC